MAVGKGKVGAPLNISIPSPRLWSPQDPHLYKVFATLYSDNTTASSFLAVRPRPSYVVLTLTPIHQHAKQSDMARTSAQQQKNVNTGHPCPQAGIPPAAVLDEVSSYAGMRKIALGQTYPDGPLRILLNNKPILQLGLLDQARPL